METIQGLKEALQVLTTENQQLKKELQKIQGKTTALTDYLRPKEVQVILGLSRSTLDRLIKIAKLPSVKIMGKIYVKRQAVNDYYNAINFVNVS